jgi:hypothetical protein
MRCDSRTSVEAVGAAFEQVVEVAGWGAVWMQKRAG